MFKTGKYGLKYRFRHGKHLKSTTRATPFVAIMALIILCCALIITISPMNALFSDSIENISNIIMGDWTPPVITLNGSNPMIIIKGTSYVEPGYTAIDYVDGDVTANVIVNSNINIDVAGTYTVQYKVQDSAGNSTTVVRTVIVAVLSEENNFDYTGGIQTYIVPTTGIYQLQVWGAQSGGGNAKGGYSTGKVRLIEGDILYIYVGGQGVSGSSGTLLGGFNGGGSGFASANGTSGGGATDIRINTDSLYSRSIVAGRSWWKLYKSKWGTWRRN